MTCQITSVDMNGYSVDEIGRPHDLEVYARVDGTCPYITFIVELAPTQNHDLAIFTRTVQVIDGAAGVIFTPDDPIYPCGQRFWVTATCEGGDCWSHGWIELHCKDGIPTAGPGNVGGQPGGTGSWPWPAPPSIFCPMVGRGFIGVLFLALTAIIAGTAMASPAYVTGGVVLLTIAFSSLALWRHWCAPPICYVVGAILWVLKRAFVAAFGIALVLISVQTGLLALAFGVCAGICTAFLRQRGCSLPKLSTPLANLPVW